MFNPKHATIQNLALAIAPVAPSNPSAQLSPSGEQEMLSLRTDLQRLEANQIRFENRITSDVGDIKNAVQQLVQQQQQPQPLQQSPQAYQPMQMYNPYMYPMTPTAMPAPPHESTFPTNRLSDLEPSECDSERTLSIGVSWWTPSLNAIRIHKMRNAHWHGRRLPTGSPETPSLALKDKSNNL
ncbi:hypothetical protein F5Y05DRAFT_415243 [Hypoxylon sp. FL0543]|nr:hypothetical protein F5Y05DRAFT_415243 [Hypoxylon sp. FL0543]